MKIPISPKSAFAPIRYQSFRPWWKDIKKPAIKCGMGAFNQRAKLLQQEIHPTLLKIVRERLGVSDPRVFQAELGALQVFGGFVGYGRVIYELSETLTDNLAVTDFHDATIEDIEIPEGTFYLQFGDHPALHLDGVQYEGAFVSWKKGEGLLSVQAVRQHAFAKRVLHFAPADDLMSLPVFLDVPTETITTSIERSRRKIEEQNKAARAQLEVIRSQYPTADIRGAEAALADLPPAETHHRLTSLALATLCYLTARPEDMNETWPSDTPSDIMERASDTKLGGKQATAQRQLESDGYIKVRFIGAALENSGEATRYFKRGENPEETKRTIATHPRRPHFRRQPCGPGRADRRLKFIPATIVNPGGAKLGPGKIFAVS